MKKLIFCGAAAAIIAGCSSKDEPIVVFDAQCEQVAKFDSGNMIVKCPVTRILGMAQQKDPNNTFSQWGDLPLAEFAADTEHAYVDVVPAGTAEGPMGRKQFRVMVPGADVTSDRWAVAILAE